VSSEARPTQRRSRLWSALARSPRWGQARALFRVLRANPVTLVGFLLVLVIFLFTFAVALPPALSGPLVSARQVDSVNLPTPGFESWGPLAGLGQALFRGFAAIAHTIAPILPAHVITLVPYPPNAATGAYAQPPSWQHLLGTDDASNDIYSKVLTALPLDLLLAMGISGIALVTGTGLGMVAGFWDRPRSFGRAASVAILRLTDIFLAFPSLVLTLALAAALGRSIGAVAIAIVVSWWPYYVRLSRGEVLAVKHQPYVMAARAAGVSEVRILFRHVLRNILEPLIVYYTMDIGTVLIVFSTISFVALPLPFTTPEWGTMVEFYESNLTTLPWTILGPGLAIFFTVLAFSLLGDGLRDLLDPRSRRVLAQGPAAATAPAESAALPSAGSTTA
jgi:peptide/nickel transport system permease protein